MRWYWPEGNHNGPRPKAEGHYGYPKVNTKAISLQTTIKGTHTVSTKIEIKPGTKE